MQAQYTQSDTIAGHISKSNTFMQSAIGTVDSYIASSNLLYSISGDPILEYRIPHCHSMLVRFISTSSLQNQLLPVISGDVHALECDPPQPARYFYHADHLGSATWITDSVGNPAQFLQYLPYGELWKNQKPMGYDERFKYTGKERDDETGYDYFGARHYTSSLSGWLSPDPLMDKYPGISPYAYCNWNPMKYVDPDGKKIVVGTWYGRLLSKLGVNNYEAKVTQELEYLKAISPQLNTGIRQLEDSQHKYYIKQGNNNQYNRKDKTITYDQGNDKRKDGAERPSKVALAHEVGHAVNDDNNATVTYDKSKALNGDVTEQNKMILNEITSIEYENEVRANEKCNMRSYNYLDND